MSIAVSESPLAGSSDRDSVPSDDGSDDRRRRRQRRDPSPFDSGSRAGMSIVATTTLVSEPIRKAGSQRLQACDEVCSVEAGRSSSQESVLVPLRIDDEAATGVTAALHEEAVSSPEAACSVDSVPMSPIKLPEAESGEVLGQVQPNIRKQAHSRLSTLHSPRMRCHPWSRRP